MDDQTTRRRSLDFFMGLGFAALGAYVAAEGFVALGDPLLATVPRTTNPGSTTIVIGGLLALLGLAIAGMGLAGTKGRPFAVAARVLPTMTASRAFFKGALVLAYVAVYFFALWRAVPFWLSTGLFLAGTMATFKAGKWWKILLIAAIATALIYYIFAVLAFVPLPDDFFWERAARPRRS
ncbi:MAG: tripartite tricarboxylate transporter TctB family protein [Spirochaetaceae bacterium]|nr:tripartite tricarboxylate transporter TctB family protein [Spirochaetaceae bacterium]